MALARSYAPALRRLADETLHASDLRDLARLLTRSLPAAIGVEGASLLVWDRKLQTFEGLPPGEGERLAAGALPPASPPEARYLVSDGQVVETKGQGQGALVPLMA